MHRSPYDEEVICWSPQGRLFQVEYAMEAVKQGSAILGLRSKTHAVLVSFNRQPSDLAYYQQKIFAVDEHIGIAIAGLTADARLICKNMRNECLNHKYLYETPLKPERLVLKVVEKAQMRTQQLDKRPYGVGLLVAAYDEQGPHLFEIHPDAQYFEFYATAMGARTQTAKTYLEKHFETFPNLDENQLISHGIKAMQACMQSETEITKENCSVAVIGPQIPFHNVDKEIVATFIEPQGQPMEIEQPQS